MAGEGACVEVSSHHHRQQIPGGCTGGSGHPPPTGQTESVAEGVWWR